jgi:hypothetical protein
MLSAPNARRKVRYDGDGPTTSFLSEGEWFLL